MPLKAVSNSGSGGGGGSGTVTGPASSTDNAIVRWDGTGGTSIQDSVVTIADTTGAISGARSISLSGSSSGSITLAVPAAAGSNTITFPAGTTDFTATGGTGQFLKQNSTGGTITVAAVAVGEVSGLGTGVATALAVNTGSAGAIVLFNGALGTPSSGTATNLTGTASGLTAGTVTTNANLTGVITSSGNATSIASQTGTGTKFVVDNTPTLITPVLGVATGTSIALGGATIGSDALGITGTVTVSGLETAAGFSPTSSTATGNRLYLPASNTLGLSVNGTGTVQLTSTALSPISNDGAALGVKNTNAWSDLFLASGAVLDYSNGNVVLTHSSNLLTLTTGTLALNSNYVSSGGFGGTASTQNLNVGGATSGSAAITGVNLAALQIGASSNVSYRVNINGNNNTTLGTSNSYAALLVGASTVTEAGSGVHPLYASVAIKPAVITAGVATATNSATLYIEDAITATVTGANYALWVDAGNVQFDGNLTIGGNTISTGTLKVGSKDVFVAVVKQVFTASGTYTPTTGLAYCIIEVVGGGAGGGAANGVATFGYGGGGGGSGSYARLYATAATIGASQTVTIGAGGAGGTTPDNDGSAGGDTSVGALCIGKGGSGGVGLNTTKSGSGGAGGVAGTGDVVPVGNAGGAGLLTVATTSFAAGGFGGPSFFGGGPVGMISTSGAVTGNAGAAYGSGGSGGSAYNTASDAAGGAGGAGYVVITEFLKV